MSTPLPLQRFVIIPSPIIMELMQLMHQFVQFTDQLFIDTNHPRASTARSQPRPRSDPASKARSGLMVQHSEVRCSNHVGSNQGQLVQSHDALRPPRLWW